LGFKLQVFGLGLGFSLGYSSCNADKKPLTACLSTEPTRTLVHACRTELLQMSRSTKQVIRSELVMRPLQPIAFT